jgi:general secretion pathway protein A
MYPQFFGLNQLPFRLRPDADFLYAGPEYLRARVELLGALHGNSRVVLLSGAPGVGKTLLLEDVLRDTTHRFALCRINQPHISAIELLQALLLQFGAPALDTNTSRSQLLARLAASIEAVGRGVAPLLIVDDAQLLGRQTLRTFEEILGVAPRLKILLAGRSSQGQGIDNLAHGIFAQQEPSQVPLPALSAEGAKAYIERRLAIAGAGGKELFSEDAQAMIFRHTGGAARLINVLCDAALHAAYSRTSGHVSAAEIGAATQDSRWPEAVARNKTNPAPTDEPRTAPARLFVKYRDEPIAALPLEAGRISIGRADDNDLRLDARFISRHHCQVVTVENVSTIEDLGSANGIYVNGECVKRHLLQHEDEITLGDHVLTYRAS